MGFEKLGLSPAIIKAIADVGYASPTPIQEQCIPLILDGHDVIGQAQTGTGKTAAFALPLLDILQPNDNKKKPALLILTPTRELAVQISEEIRKFLKYREGLRTVTIYGGVPITRQIQEIAKGADIVVGCPGRIIDHINRHTLRFDECTRLVLDEADEMLDMGFRPDIETIISCLPKDRQTLLFSATMPQPIIELADMYQNDPILVKDEAKTLTADNITQEVYKVNQADKTSALFQLIQLMDPQCCMIFCNTKRTVDRINSELVSQGYSAAAIHGDMKQEARAIVLKNFRDHQLHYMVCTDVAARGLDIDDVELVINYDYPTEQEYYVHRIGRTARAGRSGKALTLLTPKQFSIIHELPGMTGANLEVKPLPSERSLHFATLNKLKKDIMNNQHIRSDHYTDDLMRELNSYGLDDHGIARILIQTHMNKNAFSPIDKPKDDVRHARSKKTSWIRLSLGKKDDISQAHIVSAIAEAAGIDGQDIGKIRLDGDHTDVEIPEEFQDDIISSLKHTTINGEKFTVVTITDRAKKETASKTVKPKAQPKKEKVKPGYKKKAAARRAKGR